jgi:hypothetical protein
MSFETVRQFIIALPEEEGQPLSWWTGDVTPAGDPVPTASYTLAFPFRSEERARAAAEQYRLSGAWRVQPMRLTRTVAARG